MVPVAPKSLLTAAILAAALTLTTAPPVAAAPLPAERSSSWTTPWDMLTWLWDEVSSLIDPSGQTTPPPVSSTISPNGQAAPPNEVSSTIDPDG